MNQPAIFGILPLSCSGVEPGFDTPNPVLSIRCLDRSQLVLHLGGRSPRADQERNSPG